MAFRTDSSETAFSYTKEYQVGSGTIDLGRGYEYKMVAFISLRCLLQDFDDFEIACNAAGLGALDDVIINAQQKNGDNIKILLQLKHEDKAKNVNCEKFLATKGDFSLFNYCRDIVKLKENLDCKLQDISIISDLGTFNNIYFVLFTNKGTYKCEFLDNNGCDMISFLNTSCDNDNLYKFNLTNIPVLSSLPDINYNFYLFAKQSHVNHLEELIEAEMQMVFQHYGFETRDNTNNSKAFIQYITDWCMGKLGDPHYLTKHVILYKLTELSLSQYQFDLSREKFEFYDCPQKQFWNEIVHDKKITIVDSDKEMIKFLKLYIGNEIKPYCQNLEKTWSCPFSKGEQSWFYNEHASLKKSMLKVVGRNRKVTLLSIYKCLWFNESLPLLLKINSLDDYETILKILKLSNFKLKVIILSNIELNPTNMGLEYFVTLSDLNDEKRDIILNNSVKLQGRSSVLLKDLIDDSLCPFIKCNAIINIVMGNFNIGIVYEPISEYFINRSLYKIFLKIDVLKEVQDEIFVIEVKKDTDDNKISQLQEYKNNNNIIICDGHQPIEIEKLKCQKKSIHRLIFAHNNLLDWTESFGSTNNIKKYQAIFEEYFFDSNLDTSWRWNKLEDVLANNHSLFNVVKLISASPGMGKSTLLDYIASIASTELWVLNVKLNNHEEYYDSFKNGMLTSLDYLNYFNDSVLEIHNCSNMKLSRVVFQKLVNEKRVLVLFDALDEVSICYQSAVVKMINTIYKDGFSVWLTTRPHLALELEEKFATISTSLQPFSIDDQKCFLNQYFVKISESWNVKKNPTLIKEFVEKLLQASKENLNDFDGAFTGIPLQTKLLANAFTDELRESLGNGIIKFNDKFNLLNLYEEFMKRKNNILQDKFGKGAKDMKIVFENHQQLFALDLIFHSRSIYRLDIKAMLSEYYSKNWDLLKLLQQDGVVTVIQWNIKNGRAFKVNFVHRTYAEFLAARWLFINFNSECGDSKLTARFILYERFRMYANYGLLFKMFDCMVAGDSQLHLSVINGQLDKALELIQANSHIKDKCRRSFLHIVALYGTDSFGIKNEKTKFVDLIPLHSVIDDIIDIFGLTPLDYAIINNSFTIANKLCEASTKLRTCTNRLDPFFYSLLCNKAPSSIEITVLIESILLQFTYQCLLLKYKWALFGHKKFIKLIKKCKKERGVKTVSDVLVKMNIMSADASQNYYYDLRYAAAYGTSFNVQDLILSEYWSIQNYFGTPLFWAVTHNRLEIVQLLLYYEENINEAFFHGVTVLHCAAEAGHTEIVRELLSHHANVNAQTYDGETPLSLALFKKRINVAKLLLSYSACHVNIKNSSNSFPVYYAAMHGFHELIPTLLKGVDVNHHNIHADFPLHIAIKNRHIDTVRALLHCGANCNIPYNSNGFPICDALIKDCDQVLPSILSRSVQGMSVVTKEGEISLINAIEQGIIGLEISLQGTIRQKSQNLPFHTAAQEGLEEIIPEILSKTNEGVNVTNENGQTALHLSIHGRLFLGVTLYRCSNNRSKIVSFLLTKGADPNIQDNNGNTTLHYLCDDSSLDKDDRKSVAGLLVEKGANVNLKNNNGDTPLLHLLKVFHEQSIPGHLAEIFPFLISKDNVNEQDAKGNTALHYLFENSELPLHYRKNLASLVLNKGANVNVQNNNGQSCLHLYVHYLLTYDLIWQLLELFPLVIHEANVDLQDSNGNTALHYCCENRLFNNKYDEKITSLLLKNGVNVNLKNKNGETAFDWAIHFKLTEIASLLQQHKNQIK